MNAPGMDGEMTFVDFDEDSIQKEIKRIQDIAMEFDKMSAEEKNCQFFGQYYNKSM